MSSGEWNVSTPRNLRARESDLRCHGTEALQRIVGVQPAHMRPRTSSRCQCRLPSVSLNRAVAFGAYNDVVRGVASERGQKIVNWDF